ncbi:MAG TPA: hypothetical protein VF584_10460 [Longimicrobium sp.]
MNAAAGGIAPALLLVAATAHPAWAHVKWFSRFSFGDRPRNAGEVLTPTFFALALLSMATIAAMVLLDRRLADVPAYRRVNDWLSSRSDRAVLVMRIGAGAALLLSWQADAMLAPELRVAEGWLGWFQFALAFLLLFDRTVPVAGAGLIALYGIGVFRFGPFHMLDYVVYAGIGYYLAVSGAGEQKIRGSGLPALYASVGFSLCWVALEKMVYPQWGLYVLEQNPRLSLGLPLSFFLLAAAFVEFSLGYLLIINLLQRPLALVITLVFFTTTLVFGKVEVIGHTPIHAALVVFLLEGPGRVYKPPIALHRGLALRTAFAAVNFALLLALLFVPYTYGAARLHREHAAHALRTGVFVRPGSNVLEAEHGADQVEITKVVSHQRHTVFAARGCDQRIVDQRARHPSAIDPVLDRKLGEHCPGRAPRTM